jgi:hypothetical protein
MVRRLIFGMLVGLVVGVALAAALVKLGPATFVGTGGEVIAYLTAAVAGALTGVVAGKPIWASEAKIEGGLKAFFGALAGACAMFALRRWGSEVVVPEIGFIAGSPGPVAQLPAVSIPLVAAVLGALFGLDNTDPKPDDATAGRKRIAAGEASAGAKRRVADAPADEEEDVPAKRAKR